MVITYDLENDAVRARVAEILLGTGERVQKSVFECMLEPEEVPLLMARLQREMVGTNGNIRLYRLCAACLYASMGIGEVKSTVDEQHCVIL